MRPEMLDRLRSVARGAVEAKATDTADPHVTDAPGYTRKVVKLQRLHRLHVKNSDLGNDVSHAGFDAIDDGWTAEREAIACELGGVANRYASAFARMQAQQPDGMASADWLQALNDAGLFLDTWGSQAAKLGWTVVDLFDRVAIGCHGLLWELRGRPVMVLTENGAAIGENGEPYAWFARPTEPSIQA